MTDEQKVFYDIINGVINGPETQDVSIRLSENSRDALIDNNEYAEFDVSDNKKFEGKKAQTMADNIAHFLVEQREMQRQDGEDKSYIRAHNDVAIPISEKVSGYEKIPGLEQGGLNKQTLSGKITTGYRKINGTEERTLTISVTNNNITNVDDVVTKP